MAVRLESRQDESWKTSIRLPGYDESDDGVV